MIMLEVALELLIPRVMSRIIDSAIPSRDMALILKFGGIMIALALLSLVFGVLSGRFASIASVGFASRLRTKLFCKLQEFSFANLDRFSTASLVTRLTTDVTNTQNAFMMMIRIMFRAPFMMIFACIMAVQINRSLFRIFYAALPILLVTAVIVIIKGYPRFMQMLNRYDSLNASVQENLTGIRVVKAYVREDYETSKFASASADLRDTMIRAEKLVVSAMPVLTLVMNASLIAVSWLGGRQIIAGNMTVGELMSYNSYIMQILLSLLMVAMIFVSLVLSRASFRRIGQVLTEESTVSDKDADPDIAPEDGTVDFEHVSFSYAQTPVLRDVCLHIPSGQMVGIIGPTGSSKSSLVQLIPRLYDATEGCVRVGGQDVRRYALHPLRNAVAMVLQKNVLFSGTIRENLLWGDPGATDEEIAAACRAAQADEFITSFPEGYDTYLEQGGVNLSGGQKQRLCIARALLKHPRILILDDSTSAVDTATDSRIRSALRSQHGDITTIVIAQRIASVQDADQIIVLDDGEVQDTGTHEQLLQRNTIYREMYESQVKEGC
ncbi:MAG: ABC transporter ATP-binding protein [Clostridia bacterium]|nr:ABC transporter ATP-binding protein [Clostridia bacterium]